MKSIVVYVRNLGKDPAFSLDFSLEPAILINMTNKVMSALDLQFVERLDYNRDACAKTPVERQIAATDKQIDQLVFDQYGLTEREIKIIEEKWE
jgi:hypothetical protein